MNRPDISVVIPVLHESEIIARTLSHTQKSLLPVSSELIVVDGDPAGGTIRSVGHPGVIRIISKKGRAVQMNAGAKKASGTVLLFLHADTRLPEHAGLKIINALQGFAVVGGAFDLTIDSKKRVFRWIEKMASIRSRLTKIPYGDQAIFIRKDYFTRMGGFAEIPIMEDIDLMRRIKRKGGKIRFIQDRVSTSPRRWEREGVAFCTMRNIILSSLFYFGMPPDRLKRFYP